MIKRNDMRELKAFLPAFVHERLLALEDALTVAGPVEPTQDEPPGVRRLRPRRGGKPTRSSLVRALLCCWNPTLEEVAALDCAPVSKGHVIKVAVTTAIHARLLEVQREHARATGRQPQPGDVARALLSAMPSPTAEQVASVIRQDTVRRGRPRGSRNRPQALPELRAAAGGGR